MDATTEDPNDDEIRAVVNRLSRPHPSGGRVIERAAILAEGGRSEAIMAWITTHAWEPEDPAPARPVRATLGLHSARGRERDQPDLTTPRRYVQRPEAGS